MPTGEEALRGADAAVIATEWTVYRDLGWGALRDTMRHPLIIDGRRLLAQDKLRDLGYEVERVGDGVPASGEILEGEPVSTATRD